MDGSGSMPSTTKRKNIMFSKSVVLSVLALVIAHPSGAYAWGKRAHAVIDAAAVDALPADGPIFLQKYKDYISDSSTIPDSWRSNSEPFSKIEEDPNHGWFMEQFSFMQMIPRSRYEFVIELYKENVRLSKTDGEAAKKMNVRWTGTLPFAAMEVYGHLIADMRLLRGVQAKKQDTSHLELTCAMLTWWLGHYIGDGSQPLHDSIHHDGWQGSNPHDYTRDRSIHSRFESAYVDKIGLKEQDILPRIGLAEPMQGDLFKTILAYLKDSNGNVERIYQLDQQQAFLDPNNEAAREMVYERTTAGARMLRDLINQAWIESAKPPTSTSLDPTSDKNPDYNPETGSAPALVSKASR
jgi:hypothetical protein